MEDLSKMELKDYENDDNKITTSLTPSDPISLKDYKPLNPQKCKNKKIPIKILIALFISFFLIFSMILSNKRNEIDIKDEFLKLDSIKSQIEEKNLTSFETIYGGNGNIGNALFILNNLINICENIKCKNVLIPEQLGDLIKNKIKIKSTKYKNNEITILPPSYKKEMNITLNINAYLLFIYRYKDKKHKLFLDVVNDEILNNLPAYKANPDDLYINIRSGDVFVNIMHGSYSQPPLCFYQKIIQENKFQNIYLISNGKENPLVDILLNSYPNIQYMHGTPIEDMSVLVNVYNLVLPVSSFPYAAIRFNDNLKNLFIYDIMIETELVNWYAEDYYFKNMKYTIYKMKPSSNYEKIMKGKWQKSKIQLDLMINEECINNSFEIIEGVGINK